MDEKSIDNQSFVIYNSILKAAENLNGDDFKTCILNIRDFALFDIDEETDNWAINIILSVAKPVVAAARKRYKKSVENGNKGKEFGKLGGRPKKTPSEPPQKPQSQPLYENENANVNENDYEKVNNNVNYNHNDNKNTGQNNSISFFDSLQLNDDAELSCSSPSTNQQSSTAYPSTLNTGCLKYLFAKVPNEMGEYEYYEYWLSDALRRLVMMDEGILAKENELFYSAVKTYMELYRIRDRKQATIDINQLKRIVKPKVDDYLKNKKNGGSK